MPLQDYLMTKFLYTVTLNEDMCMQNLKNSFSMVSEIWKLTVDFLQQTCSNAISLLDLQHKELK